MRKRDLRTERKKRRREDNKIFVLHTAEKIMARKGYSATSMDDIAREAQFSKATLYRYFASKGKLFFEIIVHSMNELNEKLEAVKKKNLSAGKKLGEMIRVLIEHLAEKENISRIFFMDKFFRKRLHVVVTGDQSTVSLIERKFLNRIKRIRKEMLSIMNEIIASGIKSGEFRHVDPEDVSVLLESIINGYFYGRHWQDSRYDVNKGMYLIHSYFLDGIRKKK